MVLINGLIVCSVKCQKIVQNHNFPEPEVTSSNVMFRQTNSPKPKYAQFTELLMENGADPHTTIDYYIFTMNTIDCY